VIDPNLAEGQPLIKQPEDVVVNQLRALDLMVRPYFEGHWKNELEKAKLETNFQLKVVEAEFRFRKWMMIGTVGGVFAILGLASYLFATERNDYAMQMVVGIVLVVMTFVAGYGLSKSRRSATTEDQ
jgi:hypothetical protein